MALPPKLRNFKEKEFKHPELVDPEAAIGLDDVRTVYGRPLILTDDARLPGDCPPGCSPTSLHYLGRAFDLRWTFTWTTLWDFVDAVFEVARRKNLIPELELVHGPSDKHAHLAFKTHGEPELILSIE